MSRVRPTCGPQQVSWVGVGAKSLRPRQCSGDYAPVEAVAVTIAEAQTKWLSSFAAAATDAAAEQAVKWVLLFSQLADGVNVDLG